MRFSHKSDAAADAQLTEPLNPSSLANSPPDDHGDPNSSNMSQNFTSFSDRLPQEQSYVERYAEKRRGRTWTDRVHDGASSSSSQLRS